MPCSIGTNSSDPIVIFSIITKSAVPFGISETNSQQPAITFLSFYEAIQPHLDTMITIPVVVLILIINILTR